MIYFRPARKEKGAIKSDRRILKPQRRGFFPLIVLIIIFMIALIAVGNSQKPKYRASENLKKKYRLKTTDELLREITKRKSRKGRFGLKSPDQLLRGLMKRQWYKQKRGYVYTRYEIISIDDEADLSSIQVGAAEKISTIIVLLGEVPTDDRSSAVFAPVFLTSQKNIFGSKTDFSFRWVGYKMTMKFKQKGFPCKNASLQETLIGSFLYASGTNLGFIGGRFQEETRFYTNYFSEIITLKYYLPYHIAPAFTIDSRQYFFVERDLPDEFVMPKNHYNVFPRIDLNLENMREKGIDQLSEGVEILSWIGYGVRNRWERWGEPQNYQVGEQAKTFIIYSIVGSIGFLFNNNHNIVIRGKYKGGVDNDFLSRPRFGGTIDNAKLDVVHGFTIDSFRVNNFGLINARYGFNIFKRLRMSLYFDYAHIFSPDREDIFGSGYGFRILFFGGLPIWITHGFGKIYRPEEKPFEQVFMFMTAAGW